MKKSPPFLGRKVKGYFSKQLAQLSILVTTLIVIVGTILGIHIKDNYTIGYKYYEWLGNFNTEIGVVQQEDFLNGTMTDYLEELKRDGFNISSARLNTGMRVEKIIIKKDYITEEEKIKTFILNHMKVRADIIKLKFEKEENYYYFKNQTECDIFLEKVNTYMKKESSIENVVEEINMITTEDILNQKIEDIKKEKELADKAAKKKQLTSRSNYTSTSITKRYNAPMASYVLITSSYGNRRGEFHTGVDFAAAAGTEIYAWKDGIVTFAGWKGNYGNFIIIEHEDGTVSRYAHCSKLISKVGDTVVKGQSIAKVGSTGRSTGPHLHLEILVNGSFVNPLKFL